MRDQLLPSIANEVSIHDCLWLMYTNERNHLGNHRSLIRKKDQGNRTLKFEKVDTIPRTTSR